MKKNDNITLEGIVKFKSNSRLKDHPIKWEKKVT